MLNYALSGAVQAYGNGEEGQANWASCIIQLVGEMQRHAGQRMVVWYSVRVIIYFDECYDNAHRYLVLAALFNPDPGRIHNKFLEAKRKKRYVDAAGKAREIKYSMANTRGRLKIAQRGVDCFVQSQSWFRAVVINQQPGSSWNLDYFGKEWEPKALKEARAYKKFTELLLRANVSTITNATFLTDRLTRPRGDAFLPLLHELFGIAGQGYSIGKADPTFRHIQEIDTALEEYQVGQIGDILQGTILNELIPPENPYKNKLREYVKSSLSLPSLLPEYWQAMSKFTQDERHPKYQIWCWHPQ